MERVVLGNETEVVISFHSLMTTSALANSSEERCWLVDTLTMHDAGKLWWGWFGTMVISNTALEGSTWYDRKERSSTVATVSRRSIASLVHKELLLLLESREPERNALEPPVPLERRSWRSAARRSGGGTDGNDLVDV